MKHTNYNMIMPLVILLDFLFLFFPILIIQLHTKMTQIGFIILYHNDDKSLHYQTYQALV